jgi:hypothetical protein
MSLYLILAPLRTGGIWQIFALSAALHLLVLQHLQRITLWGCK